MATASTEIRVTPEIAAEHGLTAEEYARDFRRYSDFGASGSHISNLSNAGNRRRTRPHRRRIRARKADPRARAKHHRAGHLQRDVERALLLQIEQSPSEAPPHTRQARRARSWRKRGRR